MLGYLKFTYASIYNIDSIFNVLTGNGPLPCELKYLKIPLISHQVCQNTKTGQLYRNQSRGREYPETQICAGVLDGGKDACQVTITNSLPTINTYVI